jgi:hypothetical protein
MHKFTHSRTNISIPTGIGARLQYIFEKQNWEPMAAFFWLKQALDLFLASVPFEAALLMQTQHHSNQYEIPTNIPSSDTVIIFILFYFVVFHFILYLFIFLLFFCLFFLLFYLLLFFLFIFILFYYILFYLLLLAFANYRSTS